MASIVTYKYIKQNPDITINAEEIEAVLGHELGHCKKHHITKRMCISIPMTFAILFIASKFIHMNSLYQAFGFTIAKIPVFVQLIGISLLFEVFGGFRIITKLISNWSSRKDEFENIFSNFGFIESKNGIPKAAIFEQ